MSNEKNGPWNSAQQHQRNWTSPQPVQVVAPVGFSAPELRTCRKCGYMVCSCLKVDTGLSEKQIELVTAVGRKLGADGYTMWQRAEGFAVMLRELIEGKTMVFDVRGTTVAPRWLRVRNGKRELRSSNTRWQAYEDFADWAQYHGQPGAGWVRQSYIEAKDEG